MTDGRIGPYRLLRKLSQGGMGTVYEAVHETIERRVAIKVLNPEYTRNPDAVARFFNEARAVNRIEHPGLVQIFDHGQLPDGTAYIVMEFLKGETMGRRVRRAPGSMSLHQLLRLVRQVAEALAAAHAKGIVHRDLKLDNIMLVPDSALPDGERTKLLDFGIAKLKERDGSLASTRGDQLMGTPGYMSPEQCRGAAGVDERSDVYSLGVVLYRLLAGRMPFIASGAGEIMAMHIYEQPPSLGELAEWVPVPVVTLVHRLLAKDKAARPSMVELMAEIDRLLAEVPDAKSAVSVSPSLSESGQLAVSSLEHPRPEGEGADAGDSDSVMPTVDADGKVRRELAAHGSTPSTLAVSVGQQGSFLRMRRPYPAVLLSAVGATVLVAGFVLWRRPQVQPVSRSDIHHPAGGLPGGGAIPTVAPPRPQLIRWSVYTEPPGATVVRVADGSVLGQTPWQSEQLAAPGTEELRLRLPGHVERLIRLDRSADTSRRDVLEPAAASTRHAPPPSQPKRDPAARKKPRNVAIEFED